MDKRGLIAISSLLIMAVTVSAVYFSRIPSSYAADGDVKKISEIESVTLIIRAVLLVEDFKKRPGNADVPVTARAVIIFRDKDGRPCAIDYDGVAELICPLFSKRFEIHPEDFTRSHWDLSYDYGYSIEFKVDRARGSQKGIFVRPYYIVKFRLGHLRATCEFGPRTKEEERRAGPERLAK